MKQVLKKLGMVITMLITFLSAYAYDFEVDGIYYNVVSFTEFTCAVTSGDNEYTGEIVIPAEVVYNNRTLKVVSIGTAFKGNKSLTSVAIPNSVTRIGKEAFRGCNSLTSVGIPNSVTEIGEYAFYGCNSLTSVEIGTSVTSIGDSAFQYCGSLTSVVLPNSVISMGDYIFYRCESLTSVDIQSSVKSIGKYSFYRCPVLNSVKIPDSVTSIGDFAFSDCWELTSVLIPDSVKEIGKCAFMGCGLTSVLIPDSVEQLGVAAFAYCNKLTNTTLSNNISRFYATSFYDCSSLTSISIPASVDEIYLYGFVDEEGNGRHHYHGFGECEKNLKELIIQDGTNRLRGFDLGSAPKWDYSFEKVYIGRNIVFLSNIEDGFTLPNLKQLVIGEYVTTLKYAFYEREGSYKYDGISECDKLESIISYAMTPPTTSSEFSNAQYMNIKVMVPDEALAAYQADAIWGNFWNLQGMGTSGVDSLEVEPAERTVVGRYDLNGRAVTEEYKGISIVRFSDGSTKKLVQ